MRELVLDASVVLKWFRAEGERHSAQARAVRAAFEVGDIAVTVPPLLGLELVHVAGRRWRFGEETLLELVEALDDVGFDLLEPELEAVAKWTARGLTAYDAAYVAVAERAAASLVTDDDMIVSVAPGIAEPLAAWASPSG